MLMQSAATMLRDTVFVAAHDRSGQAFALNALMTIVGGLSAWALIRSVEHGQRLEKIETFIGVNGKNGLAESMRDIKDSLAELIEVGHANRADLEMLKERSLHRS